MTALTGSKAIINIQHDSTLNFELSTLRRSERLAGKQPATSSPTAKVTVTVARVKLESLEKDSISFRLLDALLTHAPTVEGLNIIICYRMS